MSANDNASRPREYYSRDSAKSAAIQAARRISPTGLALCVKFVRGAFVPDGGGQCFAIQPSPGLNPYDHHVVVELNPGELHRRQQLGMRAAVAEHCRQADKWDELAKVSRMGSVRGMYFTQARLSREAAREIEAQLTVSTVPDSEPFYSSERDSRAVGSR